MVKALIDTNILIDHLSGRPEASAELALYPDKAVSVVTWMEVMLGAAPQLEAPTRRFLEGFAFIPLDDLIAARAVAIRKANRIKLPDAVILATAQTSGRLLVTRKPEDFPAGDPGVRAPY